MRHTVYLAFALAIIWLSNSGHYNTLLLCFGALSVAFVVWLARRMTIVDSESQPVMMAHRLPGYWAWLLMKIIASNIKVVGYIWFNPDGIDPATGVIKTGQKSDLARVIYANSITLTPGTVTLDLRDHEVVVHSLTRDGLEELREGEMERKVISLEK